MLSKHFKTSKELEKNGVPVEYGENSKGATIKFILARSGGMNASYLSYIEAITKPHRRLIQNDTIDAKTLENLLKKAFIAHSLKGWENVEAEWEEPDAEGHYPNLVFNEVNANILFDQMPDLYRDLQDISSKNTIFLENVRKADTKN